MPELAEAHVMAEDLHALVAGWSLVDIKTNEASQYHGKAIPGEDLLRLPEVIDQVQGYGKKVVISFGSGRQFVCQLGMEGRWLSSPGSKSGLICTFAAPPPSSTLFAGTLPDHLARYILSAYQPRMTLYFDDARKTISKLHILPDEAALQTYLGRFGPDPLLEQPTLEEWQTFFKWPKSRARIATVINDQEVVHGVGNYLRAEILYRARLSPHRRVCDITAEEFTTLIRELNDVAQEAYQRRGHTLRTYVHLDGSQGTFEPQVYGQTTDPLGNLVERLKLGGQTFHWVPSLQT